MNKIILSLVFIGTLLIISCGQPGDPIARKKEALQKLKDEQSAISKQILQAEDELSKLDTSSSVKKEQTKLVAVQALAPGNFTHFIDLQGKIDALNIAYVTPRNGVGGQVKEIYVKQGDAVKKGQLLLKLDDAILVQQFAQAKQQLSFAQNLYERRKNLWADKIGTEVELVTAKNQVDQAQRQIDIVNQQIDQTRVFADISGVADQVNIRLGEFFNGNNQIRIVNTSNLKSVAQVPEAYLSKVNVGSNVKVLIPELNNKVILTKISVTGKLIDPNTRSFYVEAKIPYEKDLYPNQVALIRIQDYTVQNAITVPVNTLQNDENGKYVMIATKEGGRLVAHKKPVIIGMTYDDKIEIKSGVQAGDSIITDGYQGLYDGQPISTQS